MNVIITGNLGAFPAGRYNARSVTVPAGTRGVDMGPWPIDLRDDAPWRLIRVTVDGEDYDVPAVEGDHYEKAPAHPKRTKRQPSTDNLRSLLP